MAVLFCLALPCLISSISIYYALESDIRVKSNDHLNFSRPFIAQFWTSQYIMVLNHAPFKKLWPLQFAKIFLVQIRPTRYIIVVNWTSESKVMAVWICPALPRLISSVSIYYAPESDIRVKSYDLLNFSRPSVVQFRASRDIMSLNKTPESKVMTVAICWELSCSNLSLSIYYWPESDIWVKCYGHFILPSASMCNFEHLDILCTELDIRVKSYDHFISRDLPLLYFEHLKISKDTVVWVFQSFHVQFWVSRYIIGMNQTSKWKVTTVWISRDLLLFNFEHLDISWA